MIFSMLLKALMLHYYNLALLPNYIDIIKLFLRTTNYRTLKICHFFSPKLLILHPCVFPDLFHMKNVLMIYISTQSTALFLLAEI